jgi:hypothetical protein
MTGIRRALAPVLLSVAALAAAFAAHRSLACPIQLPQQPLRTLYRLSERVVVARVGVKEVLQMDKEAETASVRIALHVTENVKGPPAEVLYYHRDEYAGKDAAETESIMFSGRPVPKLKRGERYLFFLDPREGGGYEINDESFGIKELKDEDLKVYLERMKELAELTRQGTEDKHALVEWLVRCAEHPATRWEGAYELLESAEFGARVTALAELPRAEEGVAPSLVLVAPPAPQPQSPEVEAAADNIEEVPIRIDRLPAFENSRYTRPDPELAALLNAVQKQRLSDALFATDEPKEGDDELMQIVRDFGDPRFPGFILARLHRFEEDPPIEAELWLRTLAAALKNERVVELADAYTQEATYYEDEETEAPAESVESVEAAPVEASGAEEAAEEVEETPVDPEVEAAREAAAAERARVKRSALFKSLLTRLDLFVATGQLAEARP